MRPLAASTGLILAGGTVCAALAWVFLNTPESTILMLGVSLGVVLAMYAVAALTLSGALLGWTRGWSLAMAPHALKGVALFLPSAAGAAVVWWTVGRALGWLDATSGEISAWFIATLDWSDVRPVLTAANYAGEWIRGVLAPLAALAWLHDALAGGWRAGLGPAAIKRALSPVRLAQATLIVAGTIVLPFQYVLYWMPPGLPPTWVQPAFAAAKLGGMALVAAAGLSLIARLAARR